MVLIAAYGGLRFGKLAALRYDRVEPLPGRPRRWNRSARDHEQVSGQMGRWFSGLGAVLSSVTATKVGRSLSEGWSEPRAPRALCSTTPPPMTRARQ